MIPRHRVARRRSLLMRQPNAVWNCCWISVLLLVPAVLGLGCQTARYGQWERELNNLFVEWEKPCR